MGPNRPIDMDLYSCLFILRPSMPHVRCTFRSRQAQLKEFGGGLSFLPHPPKSEAGQAAGGPSQAFGLNPVPHRGPPLSKSLYSICCQICIACVAREGFPPGITPGCQKNFARYFQRTAKHPGERNRWHATTGLANTRDNGKKPYSPRQTCQNAAYWRKPGS